MEMFIYLVQLSVIILISECANVAAVTQTYFKSLSGVKPERRGLTASCGKECARKASCSGFILDDSNQCQLQTTLPLEPVCAGSSRPCFNILGMDAGATTRRVTTENTTSMGVTTEQPTAVGVTTEQRNTVGVTTEQPSTVGVTTEQPTTLMATTVHFLY